LLADIEEEFVPSQNVSRVADITIRESQSFSAMNDDLFAGDAELEQGLGGVEESMLNFDLDDQSGSNTKAATRESFSMDDIEVGRDAAPERSFAPDASVSFDTYNHKDMLENNGPDYDGPDENAPPLEDFGPIDDFSFANIGGDLDDKGISNDLDFDMGELPIFEDRHMEPIETDQE
jgi:hypothetical protein